MSGTSIPHGTSWPTPAEFLGLWKLGVPLAPLAKHDVMFFLMLEVLLLQALILGSYQAVVCFDDDILITNPRTVLRFVIRMKACSRV